MLLILLRSTSWAWNSYSYSSSRESQTASSLNLAPQSKEVGDSLITSNIKGDVDVFAQTSIFGQPSQSPHTKAEALQMTSGYLRKFVVPQLLLTFLALTKSHVQIVLRISSGYMVWYWWLATRVTFRSTDVSMIALRFSIIYAMLQGGLFASFLPPA